MAVTSDPALLPGSGSILYLFCALAPLLFLIIEFRDRICRSPTFLDYQSFVYRGYLSRVTPYAVVVIVVAEVANGFSYYFQREKADSHRRHLLINNLFLDVIARIDVLTCSRPGSVVSVIHVGTVPQPFMVFCLFSIAVLFYEFSGNVWCDVLKVLEISVSECRDRICRSPTFLDFSYRFQRYKVDSHRRHFFTIVSSFDVISRIDVSYLCNNDTFWAPVRTAKCHARRYRGTTLYGVLSVFYCCVCCMIFLENVWCDVLRVRV